MKGSSGARIELFEFSAVKSGDHRVLEQGRWLFDRQDCRALPRVTFSTEDGYSMERLVELGEGESISINDVFEQLQKIWALPDRIVLFDPIETYNHLSKTVEGVASRYLTPFIEAIRFLELADSQWALHRHTIHGDPTLENVMKRHNGEYVLIDPLPATVYAPSLRAVDLGKVLQSSAGWEFDRYDNDHRTWLDLHLELMAQRYGELETTAALRFTLIHLMRAMPYIDEAAQQRVLDGSMREVVDHL